MNSRRPLVTVLGASGFIGSAVTAALSRRPVRLRAVARRPSAVPAGAAEVEVREADLTSPSAVADAVAGADAVVHLVARIEGAATWRASESDGLGERANLGVLLDTVGALRGARRAGPPPVVVFAGSASQVCAPVGGRIDGTEPDAPVSVYGRHKLGAERALKQASAEGVLRGVVLRLPTVFGQGPASVAPDRGVCATMIRRALAGEPLTMWHDGTVERDLLYVEDAARAFLAALDHADALAGRHWVVGTGVGTPLRALFTRIAELVAAATGAPPVPVASVPAPPEAAATDSVGYAIDSSAFRAATGWRPEVSLDDGLAATVRAMAGSALVRPA